MEKVRFACPRCQTIMQTGADKIGYDVACPHCAHRFRLIEPDAPSPISLEPTVDIHDGIRVLDTGNLGGVPAPGLREPVRTKVGFQCPYCQTTRTPVMKSQISQLGWVVFAVLLLTTCFGAVVGLFIRESYKECSQCKIRLG